MIVMWYYTVFGTIVAVVDLSYTSCQYRVDYHSGTTKKNALLSVTNSSTMSKKLLSCLYFNPSHTDLPSQTTGYIYLLYLLIIQQQGWLVFNCNTQSVSLLQSH